MTKTNIIVLNDKGGCGKSLVTAGTFLAAVIHHGLTYKGVEAESEPRLALRYPHEFEHVQITNTEATMARDANAAIRQFDTIFEKLETGGYLIDLGANVAERMFEIFEATDPTAFVGDGSKCAIVIVTTSDTNAIKSAIKNAETARRVLPGAKFFLVLNDVNGKIPDAAPFLKTMKSAGFEILRIPVCMVDAWNIVSDQPLSELVAIDPASLMKFGMPKGDAMRDAREIRSFITALANSLLPIAAWAKGA
jgi:MinD-like ATPase involved in chromosome partitioning or flagellar assembly